MDSRKLSRLLFGSSLTDLIFFETNNNFFSENSIDIGSVETKENVLRQSWSKYFGTLQCCSRDLINHK